MSSRVWFLVHTNGLVVREGEGGVALPIDDEFLGDEAEAHDLGELGGARALALAIENVPDGFSVRNLRTLFGALDEASFEAALRANHVIDWATTSRFCGRCGAATVRVATERAMRCPTCELTAYPRIAPAIIVLVRRGKQALLARGARFPLPFFSTLAGFSEIGESLEQTLVREVFEEVGVRVGSPRYFGSQPWPFPHSLMVGFFAEWESGEIRIDPSEIVDAKWFDAHDLPQIPPRLSIARKLIDAWVSEVG